MTAQTLFELADLAKSQVSAAAEIHMPSIVELWASHKGAAKTLVRKTAHTMRAAIHSEEEDAYNKLDDDEFNAFIAELGWSDDKTDYITFKIASNIEKHGGPIADDAFRDEIRKIIA